MKAIVINCRRNGLGVIRSLGRKGVDVIALDHRPDLPAFHSRYTSRACVVPSVAEDEPGLLDAILAIASRESPNEKLFLVPTNDEYVLAFARNWSALKHRFHPVFETNLPTLLDCLEKTRMYLVAQRAGIPCPKTVYSPSDAQACRGLGWPVVVKPENRRTPEHIRSGGLRIAVCRDRDELSDTIAELRRLSVGFIAQEHIPGRDDQLYTAGICAQEGTVKAIFTGRKIRQFPPGVGECSYGELVDEPEIAEHARRFIAETGYTGIAQIEFKKHGNACYFIEINPRSWSWNSLADYAGVNLPWTACQIAVDAQVREVRQKRFAGAWIYTEEDLRYNVLRARRVSPVRVLAQSIMAERHAYWDSRDPAPALAKGLGIIRRQAVRLARALRTAVRSCLW